MRLWDPVGLYKRPSLSFGAPRKTRFFKRGGSSTNNFGVFLPPFKLMFLPREDFKVRGSPKKVRDSSGPLIWASRVEMSDVALQRDMRHNTSGGKKTVLKDAQHFLVSKIFRGDSRKKYFGCLKKNVSTPEKIGFLKDKAPSEFENPKLKGFQNCFRGELVNLNGACPKRNPVKFVKLGPQRK